MYEKKKRSKYELIIFCLFEIASNPKPPVWGSRYTVKSVFNYPDHKFEAAQVWYDVAGRRSRVDYTYADRMLKKYDFLKIGPFGTEFTVIETSNASSCFERSGSKENPIQMISMDSFVILIDLSSFQWAGKANEWVRIKTRLVSRVHRNETSERFYKIEIEKSNLLEWNIDMFHFNRFFFHVSFSRIYILCCSNKVFLVFHFYGIIYTFLT